MKFSRRRPPEPAALQRLYALDDGKTEPPRTPKERPHRRHRIVAAIWTSAVVAAAGLLLLLVLPTRAWLGQRDVPDPRRVCAALAFG